MENRINMDGLTDGLTDGNEWAEARSFGMLLITVLLNRGKVHQKQDIDAAAIANIYDNLVDDVTADDIRGEAARYNIFILDTLVQYATQTRHAPEDPYLVGDEVLAMMERAGR